MEKDMKIGFIGMGNMAFAILSGVLKSGFIKPSDVSAFDVNRERLDGISLKTGICAVSSAEDLCLSSDLVIMAVKPKIVPAVVDEINDLISDKPLLSIAYNIGYDNYKNDLGLKARVQYIIPNIPCMSLEGMTLFEDKTDFRPDELDFVKAMFSSVGETEVFPYNLLNKAGGLTSCGPAFAAMVAESLADAVVLNGIPYPQAFKLAAQLLKGTGAVLQDTGIHPAQLKDNVCSPGGYTIKGVKSLEEDGLRAAIIHAVEKTI
jgi:pyrroline-5-carboxylate reductase